MPNREKARRMLAENGHGGALRGVNVRSVDQKSGEKAIARGEVGKVPMGTTMSPDGLARGGVAGKRKRPRKIAAAPAPMPVAPPAAPMEPDGDEAMMAGPPGAPPGSPPFKRGGRC